MESNNETIQTMMGLCDAISNDADTFCGELAVAFIRYRLAARKCSKSEEALDVDTYNAQFQVETALEKLVELAEGGPRALRRGLIAASKEFQDLQQRAAARDVHQINDPAVRAQVFSLTEGKCAYCDVTLVNGGGDAEQFCVEHVVPVSKGGPNNIVNYVPSCRSCNNSKKDGHVLMFIRRNLPRRQEAAAPAATVIPMQQRNW